LATATVVAEGSATASYYYDGDGRRVQTIRGSDHVHYLRDADGNIIAEYDSAGSLLLEHIYLDGRRIATVLPTGHRFYIQQDVLGSNWQVTTSAFSLTSLFESYEPFGWVMPDIDTESAPIPLSGDVLCTGANPIFCDDFETGDTTLWTCTDPGTCASDPTAPRYTGKDLDQLTGLYDFDARYYDGRIGRFISPDPGPWHLENPQSINRYAYALNSPYKYVDPDGESPVVLGALIGGGVGAVGYLTANLIANDFSISASVDAISGRDLLASTVGGATSGALAVATFGFSLVGEGVIGATAAGALGNVVGGYVTRSLDTDSSTNPADLRSAGQDLAFGALGGSFGYGAGQLARSPLPGVRAQIEASRPGARAGNWGSAQSVRGHTAKVARIENLATAVDASIGETSTSVAQPVIEAIREKEN
jgi:RHS repeat-associated protein